MNQLSPENRDILDAAFDQARAHSSSREAQQEAESALSYMFPHASARQIKAAYVAARQLIAACYEIGDACRAEHMTREQAEADLAERFPGFSQRVYGESVSYGLFISR